MTRSRASRTDIPTGDELVRNDGEVATNRIDCAPELGYYSPASPYMEVARAFAGNEPLAVADTRGRGDDMSNRSCCPRTSTRRTL